MSTYVTTLKDNSGNELLPKTVLKAIADDDGYYLDSSLKASDINPLKDGLLANSVRHNDEVPGTPPSINAGQLNGHYDSYFATESEMDIVRGNSQAYDPTDTYDTGDYAIQANILYRCLEDNVTGVFDSTKWEVVDLTTLKDEVVSIGKWIDVKGSSARFDDPHLSVIANESLRMVVICGYIANCNWSTLDGYNFGEIVTTGYRPSNDVAIAMYVNITSAVLKGAVTPSGNCVVNNNTSFGGNQKDVYLNCTYVY